MLSQEHSHNNILPFSLISYFLA